LSIKSILEIELIDKAKCKEQYDIDRKECINKCTIEYEEQFDIHYKEYRKTYFNNIIKKYNIKNKNYLECDENQRDIILTLIDLQYDKCIINGEIMPILTDNYKRIIKNLNMQRFNYMKSIHIKKEFNPDVIYKVILIIGTFVSMQTSKEKMMAAFKKNNIKLIFMDEIINSSNNDVL
jgi:hypothetical protein